MMSSPLPPHADGSKPPLPDPHFGTDDQMLAWCATMGIKPVKDADGEWDWHAAWAEYLEREESEKQNPPESKPVRFCTGRDFTTRAIIAGTEPIFPPHIQRLMDSTPEESDGRGD